MTLQSYQPQIDARVYENAAKQKRLVRMLVGWVGLAAFILLSLKYHDRLRSFLFGTSSDARIVTSNSTTEKPRHINSSTSRRTSSTHSHGVPLLAAEGQVKLASGLSESTMRPPLVVEVISGSGQRQWIRTRDDSIYLALDDNTVATSAPLNVANGYQTGEIKAAELQPTIVELSPAIGSANPVPAKQRTVEGSVVLLARIDKDGNIGDLQAISGPENLLDAAREAVRHWRFKPYYQSGQPVPTDAQITVKFTIASQ